MKFLFSILIMVILVSLIYYVTNKNKNVKINKGEVVSAIIYPDKIILINKDGNITHQEGFEQYCDDKKSKCLDKYSNIKNKLIGFGSALIGNIDEATKERVDNYEKLRNASKVTHSFNIEKYKSNIKKSINIMKTLLNKINKYDRNFTNSFAVIYEFDTIDYDNIKDIIKTFEDLKYTFTDVTIKNNITKTQNTLYDFLGMDYSNMMLDKLNYDISNIDDMDNFVNNLLMINNNYIANEIKEYNLISNTFNKMQKFKIIVNGLKEMSNNDNTKNNLNKIFYISNIYANSDILFTSSAIEIELVKDNIMKILNNLYTDLMNDPSNILTYLVKYINNDFFNELSKMGDNKYTNLYHHKSTTIDEYEAILYNLGIIDNSFKGLTSNINTLINTVATINPDIKIMHDVLSSMNNLNHKYAHNYFNSVISNVDDIYDKYKNSFNVKFNIIKKKNKPHYNCDITEIKYLNVSKCKDYIYINGLNNIDSIVIDKNIYDVCVNFNTPYILGEKVTLHINGSLEFKNNPINFTSMLTNDGIIYTMERNGSNMNLKIGESKMIDKIEYILLNSDGINNISSINKHFLSNIEGIYPGVLYLYDKTNNVLYSHNGSILYNDMYFESNNNSYGTSGYIDINDIRIDIISSDTEVKPRIFFDSSNNTIYNGFGPTSCTSDCLFLGNSNNVRCCNDNTCISITGDPTAKCLSGLCTTLPCNKESDCQLTGTSCINNKCQINPNNFENMLCKCDKDCGVSYYSCVNNKCVKNIDDILPPLCKTNDDCTDGKCIYGRCSNNNLDDKVISCKSNYVNVINGIGLDVDASDKSGILYSKSPDFCYGDANCGSDKICKNNKCIIKPKNISSKTCILDNDCDNGSYCYNNKCLEINNASLGCDKPCSNGEVCMDGSCTIPRNRGIFPDRPLRGSGCRWNLYADDNNYCQTKSCKTTSECTNNKRDWFFKPYGEDKNDKYKAVNYCNSGTCDVGFIKGDIPHTDNREPIGQYSDPININKNQCVGDFLTLLDDKCYIDYNKVENDCKKYSGMIYDKYTGQCIVDEDNIPDWKDINNNYYGPTPDQSNDIRVTNHCGIPIWIDGRKNPTQDPLTGCSNSSRKIYPGQSMDIDLDPQGTLAGILIPKVGCDDKGEHCLIGDSLPSLPNCGHAAGCQPPIETRIEFTSGHIKGYGGLVKNPSGTPGKPDEFLGSNTYFDMSHVDGYTLPYKVYLKGNTSNIQRMAKDGRDVRLEKTLIDGSNLSLGNCPTNENLIWNEDSYISNDAKMCPNMSNVPGFTKDESSYKESFTNNNSCKIALAMIINGGNKYFIPNKLQNQTDIDYKKMYYSDIRQRSDANTALINYFKLSNCDEHYFLDPNKYTTQAYKDILDKLDIIAPEDKDKIEYIRNLLINTDTNYSQIKDDWNWSDYERDLQFKLMDITNERLKNLCIKIKDCSNIIDTSSLKKIANNINDYNIIISRLIDFYNTKPPTRENKNIIEELKNIGDDLNSNEYPSNVTVSGLNQFITKNKLENVDLNYYVGDYSLGCMAPCKKLTSTPPYGLGLSSASDLPANLYCCPTPGGVSGCINRPDCVTNAQCRCGPAPYTKYSNNIHENTQAYSFAYDDQVGGIHWPAKTVQAEIEFCPNNKIPYPYPKKHTNIPNNSIVFNRGNIVGPKKSNEGSFATYQLSDAIKKGKLPGVDNPFELYKSPLKQKTVGDIIKDLELTGFQEDNYINTYGNLNPNSHDYNTQYDLVKKKLFNN